MLHYFHCEYRGTLPLPKKWLFFCLIIKIYFSENKITSQWGDIYTDYWEEAEMQINMAHVLQALLGCTRLPVNLECGLIEFDHTSNHLPKVNMCAPSLIFSKIKDLQNYDTFHETMLYIIVGSYGFGSA